MYMLSDNNDNNTVILIVSKTLTYWNDIVFYFKQLFKYVDTRY